MRSICLLLFPLLVVAGQTITPDCSAVSGWSQRDEVRSFVPDNLYEYMDGNAEGYVLYDFQQMTGVTCVSADNSIVIDISRMSSPEMAYGMFSANKTAGHEVRKIGMAGQVMPRKATFVKGEYYVELAANPAKDHTAALDAFVKNLEPRVPGTTELPAALSWFPQEQLEAGSVRLVPQSVLGLRMLKRGYVATYASGRAFIVPESSPDTAKALIGKLKDRVGETQSTEVADEAFTGADRYLGRVLVARKGAYVMGFVNIKEGDGKAQTAALAANVK